MRQSHLALRSTPDQALLKRMNPGAMRSFNAIELLELIRSQGRISRAGLAALSRLSKPTVSGQVDWLIEKGLVVEVGAGRASARGGKRPTLVEFNRKHGSILCVDVGSEVTRFAAADLSGTTYAEFETPTRPAKGERAVLKAIQSGVARLIARNPKTPVRVISVAVPGIVDVREGVVRETDNVFSWIDFLLGAGLSAEFGAPVYIDNDVNMAALAELALLPDSTSANFVLLRLNTGVGAGIVLNGQIYHGAHWAAGEVGHMVLEAKAGAQAPGPRGYLESVVGGDRVAERLREAAARGRRDPARGIYSDVALHLGCAVANIASVYDPQAVVLLGEAFPPLLDEIRKVTARLIPWPVEIRLSELGDDAALKGALAAGVARAHAGILQSLHPEDERVRA